MFSKKDLLNEVESQLMKQLERLTSAAKATHAAATDPDSKAESKYDTRSLEESYLATGQARQVQELAANLEVLKSWHAEEFTPRDHISGGAVVTVKNNNTADTLHFLLAPVAGGLEVIFEEKEITLLSPESPLYEKLNGLQVGEKIEVPPFEITDLF